MISVMLHRPTDRRVELKGIAKRFGDVVALESLDLVVKTGEFIVLLGPRGSGKSTILRMIAGLERPSAGAVLIDGLDVTALPPGRRDIALVSQQPALYPHLSVQQNIAFPLRAQKIPRNAIERRVEEVIDRLELEPLRRLKPRHLSHADQQRVSLARTMVRDPKAFLLDDPLSGLEPEARQRTSVRMRTMHNELRATTILTTRDPAEAAALADRIIPLTRPGDPCAATTLPATSPADQPGKLHCNSPAGG
jgi:multiple sugar transport system ATP-binding protein